MGVGASGARFQVGGRSCVLGHQGHADAAQTGPAAVETGGDFSAPIYAGFRFGDPFPPPGPARGRDDSLRGPRIPLLR